MRAKAGDPPRTMAQKVLAGRADDPSLAGDVTVVKVDQVALVRAPGRALAEASSMGLKKAVVEVAITYDGTCVTSTEDPPQAATTADFVSHGILVGRPGVGFPSAVHLERFASPARLCLTDDPRMGACGGVGMLTVLASPSQLGEALATGRVTLRPPRSIQVLLSGRVRPFVCARDVALELLRRGVGEAVARVEAKYHAPVVLEFGGPSARLLSVSERAVLAALAPELGAWASVFTSDERTEVYLRDQRRSKAHRALAPDAGAPVDEVIQVDLSAVDPLLRDEQGKVRGVRDLAGKPVSQAILGGDTGATLRDLLAAASLLKSKRVPPRLDLLLAVPTRQMLEVLATEGALADLVATGARLTEPDQRLLLGKLYPPPEEGGVSIRTSDPEPAAKGQGFVVASAETVAYAVATGSIGDPRGFKRPVRVTVPRTLPTDDVLVAREKRPSDGSTKRSLPVAPSPAGWKGTQPLTIATPSANVIITEPTALVCANLDEARAATQQALASQSVRAVISTALTSGLVACLSAVGVAALRAEPSAIKLLAGAKSLSLPPPASDVTVTVGASKILLHWPAARIEREWAIAGTAQRKTTSAR